MNYTNTTVSYTDVVRVATWVVHHSSCENSSGKMCTVIGLQWVCWVFLVSIIPLMHRTYSVIASAIVYSLSNCHLLCTGWHKKTGTFEMRSGSHVQLAALRNRDLELQTTSPFSNHGSVEQLAACFRHKNVSVLLGFQNFPFFCVTLYKCT